MRIFIAIFIFIHLFSCNSTSKNKISNDILAIDSEFTNVKIFKDSQNAWDSISHYQGFITSFINYTRHQGYNGAHKIILTSFFPQILYLHLPKNFKEPDSTFTNKKVRIAASYSDFSLEVYRQFFEKKKINYYFFLETSNSLISKDLLEKNEVEIAVLKEQLDSTKFQILPFNVEIPYVLATFTDNKIPLNVLEENLFKIKSDLKLNKDLKQWKTKEGKEKYEKICDFLLKIGWMPSKIDGAPDVLPFEKIFIEK